MTAIDIDFRKADVEHGLFGAEYETPRLRPDPEILWALKTLRWIQSNLEDSGPDMPAMALGFWLADWALEEDGGDMTAADVKRLKAIHRAWASTGMSRP